MDVHTLGVLASNEWLSWAFGSPYFCEIIVKSRPEFSCNHIVVGGKEEVVCSWREVKGLAGWKICYGNASHLTDAINKEGIFMSAGVFLVDLMIWVPPTLGEAHHNFNGRHFLGCICKFEQVLWSLRRIFFKPLLFHCFKFWIGDWLNGPHKFYPAEAFKLSLFLGCEGRLSLEAFLLLL